MQPTEVNNVIEKLTTSDNWNLYALKYKHSKRNGSTFESKQISFHIRGDLLEYINTIQKEYCTKRLEHYEGIHKYDGTFNSSMIYFLKQTDNMIVEELRLLNKSLANPSINSNIDGKENAFVIQGTIEDSNGVEQLIKLITLRKPFTVLKHKFYYEAGEYKKMNEKILSLVSTFDVLIVGNDKVYFMNFNGENLFNMERTYKEICSEKVEEISHFNILNDFDSFSRIATSGHNPRKFVSYDEKKLKYIGDIKNRKEISKKFNINLDKKGKIDSSDHANVNKLIKFLCNRAVLDPTNLEPKESDGTRKWT